MREIEGPVSRTTMFRWAATGGSRRGLSHFRSGRKNEDSIQFVACDSSTKAVLAVADGHGNDLSFRSHVGSRLAVSTAIPLLTQFANSFATEDSRRPIDDQAQTTLTNRLIAAWQSAVRRHFAAKPFTQNELDELAAAEGPGGQRLVEEHPVVAYGSTLLCVIATQTYVLSVQLGDGAVLLIDPKGQTRRAITQDKRGGPMLVPSLAHRTAASEARTHLQEASKGMPKMILVATDGYTESFPSENALLKIGSDLLRAAREEGYANVDRWLERFLEEAKARGSEDDITAGLLVRLED